MNEHFVAAKVRAELGEARRVDLVGEALLRTEPNDHVLFDDVGFVAALTDGHGYSAPVWVGAMNGSLDEW